MNTFLKFASLVLAAGIPAAFTAEAFGLAVPAVINTSHVFTAFVVTLTLLTMLTDYRPRQALVSGRCVAAGATVAARAALRLAA